MFGYSENSRCVFFFLNEIFPYENKVLYRFCKVLRKRFAYHTLETAIIFADNYRRKRVFLFLLRWGRLC